MKPLIALSKCLFLTSLCLLIGLNAHAQWVFAHGCAGFDDSLSVAVDSDGNVYFTGTNTWPIDFDPNPQSSAIFDRGGFLAKHTSDGQFLWASHLPKYSSNVAAGGHAVTIGPDDMIYLAGIYYSSFRTGWIAKYHPDGTLLWSRDIAAPTTWYDIEVDRERNVYISDAGSHIAKYDSKGMALWAIPLSSQHTLRVTSHTMAFDQMNGVYVAGNVAGTIDFDPSSDAALLTIQGEEDAFIAKYDADGNYQWAFLLGGSHFDGILDIQYKNSLDAAEASNQQGFLWVSGFIQGVVDFDPSKNVAALGEADKRSSFIAKYTANGAYQWAILLPPRAQAIAISSAGEIFATGFFNSTGDFDPGPKTFFLTSLRQSDIFLAKYSPDGTFEWAFRIGGIHADLSYDIALDGSESVYITGFFRGDGIDFDPSLGIQMFGCQLRSDGWNLFLAKYNQDGTFSTHEKSTQAPPTALSLSVYPNPFAHQLQIAYTSPHAGPIRVEVFDLLGRQVALLHEGWIGVGPQAPFTFEATDLPNGPYLIRVTHAQGMQSTLAMLLR